MYSIHYTTLWVPRFEDKFSRERLPRIGLLYKCTCLSPPVEVNVKQSC